MKGKRGGERGSKKTGCSKKERKEKGGPTTPKSPAQEAGKNYYRYIKLNVFNVGNKHPSQGS